MCWRRALQWGHRLSAMETGIGVLGLRLLDVPSMGPPPFGDGNLSRRIRRRNPVPLQWGHRLSAMETPRRHPWRRRSGRPSMGPPPFGDGNSFSPRAPGRESILQWGHRLSAMETTAIARKLLEAPEAFNGATAFRRWKLHQPLRNHILVVAFNGATAFRRWKQAKDDVAQVYEMVPSMGPPPFGDGNVWGARRAYRVRRPFNGATAFRRWKRLGRSAGLPGPATLQWGHRLSAMETGPHRGPADRHRQPSMGPPPFGDGNWPPTGYPPYAAAAFNGATAFRRWKPLFLACLRRKSGRKCAFPQRTDK